MLGQSVKTASCRRLLSQQHGALSSMRLTTMTCRAVCSAKAVIHACNNVIAVPSHLKP